MLKPSGHPCRPVLLLMLVAIMLFRSSAAQSSAQATVPTVSQVTPLTPGDDLAVQLGIGEKLTYTVTIPVKTCARLTLIQGDHFELLTLAGPNVHGATRTNDSGIGAAIASTLTASDVPAAYRITLQGLHKDEASQGRLLLGPLKPETPDALQHAHAEDLFFEAESLRRGKDPKGWAQARDQFQAAFDSAVTLNDPYLQVTSLTGQARLLLFRLNDYPEAQQAATRATSISPQPSPAAPVEADHSVLTARALAYKTLSSTDYYLADYPSSIEHARQALDLYADLKDRYWQGILQGNLAYIYLEAGDSHSALETASQALATSAQLHDEYGRIFTLEALGSIHLARGELDQSFDCYQQALRALHTTPYAAVEAQVWRGLGRFYSEVAKPVPAEDAYQHAIASAHEASDNAALLEATAELAGLERSQGKLKASHASYDSALTLALASSLPREAVLLESGLALTLGAEHQPAQGVNEARQAIARATSIGFLEGEATATSNLAGLQVALADPQSARESYSQAAALFTTLHDGVQAAFAIAQLARIDAELNRLDLAERESAQALELIETTRTLVPGRELRTSYFADQQSVYTFAIRLMLRLNRLHPGQGYSERAFDLVEESRGRSLLDQSESAASDDGGPNTLSGQTPACEQRLAAAYQRLHSLYVATDNANYRILKTQQQIQSQLAECDGLASLDRKLKPQAAAHLASLRDVQRAVGLHHAALVEYWLGDTESVLWSITARRVTMLALPPRRSIEDQVLALNQALTERQRAVPGEDVQSRSRRMHQADEQAATLLTQLGATLLSSNVVATVARETQLFVVPDGALASLPFAALTVPKTNTPLLEVAEIAEEPSSSLLLQLLARPERKRTAINRIAVFADPVYTQADERFHESGLREAQTKAQSSVLQASYPSSNSLLQLARLPASGTEARSIKATSEGEFTVDIHLGFDASSHTLLTTSWGRYQVMHLAVHAILGQSPAFTGIAFSMFDREGHSRDGMLWLNQIYRLHDAPDLVFLSGCSTADGADVPGEGIASLSNAFLYRGARRVIGSLWSVEDQATSDLVQDFYRNLFHAHQAPAAALRHAQLALAHSASYRSPYYWASFQLEGLPGHASHAAQ